MCINKLYIVVVVALCNYSRISATVNYIAILEKIAQSEEGIQTVLKDDSIAKNTKNNVLKAMLYPTDPTDKLSPYNGNEYELKFSSFRSSRSFVYHSLSSNTAQRRAEQIIPCVKEYFIRQRLSALKGLHYSQDESKRLPVGVARYIASYVSEDIPEKCFYFPEKVLDYLSYTYQTGSSGWREFNLGFKEDFFKNIVPKEFRANRRFILAVLNANSTYEFAFKHASPPLKSDPNFLISALQKCGGIIKFLPESFRSQRNFVLAALSNGEWNSTILKYASEDLRGDREVVLAAVKANGYALEHASKELHGDLQVVLAAVKSRPYALKHASEAFYNNSEFMLSVFKALKYDHERENALKHVPQNLLYTPTFVKELRKTFEYKFNIPV